MTTYCRWLVVAKRSFWEVENNWKKAPTGVFCTFIKIMQCYLTGRALTLNLRETGLYLCKQVGSQASHWVTLRLAWDPSCLPLSVSFSIINKHNFKVYNSRRHLKSILRKLPSQRVKQQPVLLLELSELLPAFSNHYLTEKKLYYLDSLVVILARFIL